MIFEVKVATKVATFLGQVATFLFLNIDLGFSAEKAKKIGARRWDEGPSNLKEGVITVEVVTS